MPSPRPEIAVLHLALEVGSEPLRGELAGPDGRARPFAGWMELARLLEDAHRPDPEDTTHAH
jgi:hypothetical protein